MRSIISKRIMVIVLSVCLVVTLTPTVGLAYNDEVSAATQNSKSSKDVAEKSKQVQTRSNTNNISIKNVEVTNRGDFQNIFRDSVYKGKAENGEDASKWYTSYREINLKDPRIFNLEFTVPAADVGSDADAYLDTIDLQYGGHPLSSWGDGRDLRGTTPIFTLEDKNIVQNTGGDYTVSLKFKTESPWAASNKNEGNNIPFTGYYAGSQNSFGTGQQADNRAWWQAGPTHKGVGTYALEALAGDDVVASTDLHVGPYDEMQSWIEINEFSQSLLTALNGKPLSIDELDQKPIGNLAKGYIALDNDGNFVKGNRSSDVYVEVSIIGYGLTDNYKEENKNYNNYSRYNPQWNVVVAKDEDSVNKYLNETVPTMNNDPQSLINKYKDKAPADIDMLNVVYQNNVHSDEVTGTETEMILIKDLIDGGKAGKNIPYKSMTDDDMNYKYRVPAQGAQQGNSSHIVKEGYDENGRFMDPNSRQEKVFNTKDALDQLIFVNTLCSNPDGKAAMRRVNRYGLDMNRDVVFSTQPETISLTKDICKWDPLLVNEWHGYVATMLIEPCTAPHDPNFEYDLLQNNMLRLAYQAGLAITGSTGYANFRIPWDHLAGGAWDDGGTIYAPMFSLLLGAYGYTIEFPHSNSDSLEAGNVANYAMINELLDGETKFYEGNALNNELPDMYDDSKTHPSHEEDINDTSMRKSSVLNKLEVKRRGVENIDAETTDKYFIDQRPNNSAPWKVVGRPRPEDKDGNTLSFFPDYIVIPTDGDNQYNVAEGIKGINHMINLGVDVKVSTEDVTYEGQKIPKGAYVLDMKQGRRNLIAEIMGKGYDATSFPSMYADIYCNFPDVRGFDSVQVYGENLFNGKTNDIKKNVEKTVNIDGAKADYVVFKSQSTDAVRFVNLLLSGRSSGPSYAEKGDVWMLRKAVKGTGNASDYVIKTEDLAKINNLVDNVDLGLNGCYIEGQYIDKLPDEAVALVDPVIQFNTARGPQTGGVLWWALDDYLGFASMVDYNGGTNLRDGANVVVSNNATPNTGILDAVKKDKLGLVLIQNASALSDTNFGTGSNAPSTGSFADIAVNGEYNVDDSLFTQNYANTSTLYGRGNYFTGNIPKGSKELFRTLPKGEDAFIGGFQNLSGNKTTFGNRLMMFSTILNGDVIEGKPVQALAIGQSMHTRSHYQKLLPLLATGIYAGAAGILDDFNAPEIDDIEKNDTKSLSRPFNFTVTASEPKSDYTESGIEDYSFYAKEGKDFVLKAKQSDNSYAFRGNTDEDQTFMMEVTDYAGNNTHQVVTYKGTTGKYETYDSLEDYNKANPTDPIPTDPTDPTKPIVKTDIKVASVKSIKKMAYTGKALKPKPVVTLSGKTLVAGKDYTVKYSKNKKPGKANVTIIGKGNYVGSKVVNFKITPKKQPAVKSAKSAKKKQMTVKWKKSSLVTGYQIVIGTNKKVTKNKKTANIKKYTTVKKTFKKLKAGKTYYVKIRAFKKIDGKKVYGAWSKVKKAGKIKG